jgi:hypothetical protein
MPSSVVTAQAVVIASRTAASIAASFFRSASVRCVKHDHVRFSPVGVGPTRPLAVGEEPIFTAIDFTQSSRTLWLTSPCIRTSVGPRSRGTPIVQNHQLPLGMVQ